MPKHQAYSPEELRLNDYKNARGVTVVKSPNATWTNLLKPITSIKPRDSLLVDASLPFKSQLPQNDSCRAPGELLSSLQGGMITIVMGSPGNRVTDFAIHRELITRRSAFIREALNKNWKEAKTGIIRLPEDEDDIFALYHAWLYTGYIDSRGEAPDDGGIGQDNDMFTSKEYEKLAKCYILGDKLLDTRFKDCTVDCILSVLRVSRKFDHSLSGLVFDNTLAGSPLRELWLDIYTLCGSPNWLKDSGEYPQDFLLELGRRSMRGQSQFESSDQVGRLKQGAHTLFETCRYHEHEDGVCYRSIAVMGNRGVISAL